MIILLGIVCIVCIKSPEFPPIAVQYCCHVYHMTSILHCYCIIFSRNRLKQNFCNEMQKRSEMVAKKNLREKCEIFAKRFFRFAGNPTHHPAPSYPAHNISAAVNIPPTLNPPTTNLDQFFFLSFLYLHVNPE